MAKNTKYIFVTGGVLSSLGKGLASAAIGMLLESRGLTVTIQKLDPYINVDPGTMSPFQHGEVFVTDDGAETDLDLGHYERFTHAPLGKNNNFTTGKIYDQVITKERKGEYLGGTVQVIPHITHEIKQSIRLVSHDVDVVIVEIGGTVGDIESLPFLEAIRQFKADEGASNVIYLHLTLVPYMKKAREMKTKPTQHSVKELRSIGIQPDILLCRTERSLDDKIKEKIALFCNVGKDDVFTAIDVDCIYEVPLVFNKEGLGDKILEKLNIQAGEPQLDAWEEMVAKLKNPRLSVNIAIVGKYVDVTKSCKSLNEDLTHEKIYTESYKSLNEALTHGGIYNDAKVHLQYIDSTTLTENNVEKKLSKSDGILVPGGFGTGGVEGKIIAAKHAREKKVPYFGICLGMHIAVIEIARNLLNFEDANSQEFDSDTPYPVIYFMREWYDEQKKQVVKRNEDSDKGGTMRLGAYPCKLLSHTFAKKAYNQENTSERHRHRFEFNNKYKDKLVQAGLIISGTSPDHELVEIIELKDHPWYLGCQFHPEFKSKPGTPHPLFKDFIKASINNRGKQVR